MLTRTALFSIYLYQRHVSPRKGYRCAYSVLHGGTGCSGYAKYALRDHGLFAAVPLIRARFLGCRDAYHALYAEMANSANDNSRGEDRRKQKSDCWDITSCNSCDIPRCGRGSSNSGGDCGDCTSCD